MSFLRRAAGVGVVAVMTAAVGMCAGGGVERPGMPAIGSPLKDVPFRATQVIVRRGAGGVVETRGRMARSSDGSTYVELVDSATGKVAEVLIFDVPGRRELVLDVARRRYRVVATPALGGREATADLAAEQLRMAAMEKDISVKRVRDGVASTWRGLGVKRLGGLEAVGSVEVRRPVPATGEVEDGPAEVDESWVSVDLGIAVLRMRHDPLRGEDVEVALTEVLRAEPDARMFEVPAGFVLEGR